MRVLMTADAVGGVWTYTVELAAGLAAFDCEAAVAVLGPPPTDDQRHALRTAGISHHHERDYALEWMPEPWDDVERSGSWLLELVAALDPDILHLNGYALGALATDVPKIVVGHSCVLSWHEAVRRAPDVRTADAYASAVRSGLAGADALVAPTRAMLSALECLYRPQCHRGVIPNGLTPDAVRPLAKENFVLGVGRVWDEGKNLGALERVAGELRWPVRVAGAGGALGRFDRERLRELYGRAAIFAEPARYEPFGLSALEAGLAGCALVLGDIASLREVWDDAALYVDPFDDDELRDALTRLIRDERLRRRLAVAARRRARTFTRERMAAAYHDLYERVIVQKVVAEPALVEAAR